MKMMKIRYMFRMNNLQIWKPYIGHKENTLIHLTQINSDQVQLPGTSKDTGQGISARQPMVPTKMLKALTTL
jgi:hypothetical protein